VDTPVSATKKRVLLLSASAGAGHVRAAEALLQDFAAHPDVSEAVHWDVLKYTTPFFRHVYSKVYLDLVNRAPKILGLVYDQTDKPWKHEKRRLLIDKSNARPFIEALQKFQPDVVVCTHFTPSFLISDLVERGEFFVRPAIVVTDMDCHAMWLAHHYEHYFVALDETHAYLERMGISPSRITTSGIPIDPVFRQAKDQQATRQKLGLGNRFTLLVSAGGFGVGPVESILQELLNLQTPVQIVAIAGKSESLKTKLERLAKTTGPKVKLYPIGFTRQMDEYMAASDILISKPGGLTTSESMARGLPMCIVNPIPGQEQRNSDHLLEASVAIKSTNLPTLAWKIDRLLQTPGRFEAMRKNAQLFGRPNAGLTIVNTLMKT